MTATALAHQRDPPASEHQTPGTRGANNARKTAGRSQLCACSVGAEGAGRLAGCACALRNLVPPLPRPEYPARFPWRDGPPVPGKGGESSRMCPPFPPQKRPWSVRPWRLPPRWWPLPVSEALLLASPKKVKSISANSSYAGDGPEDQLFPKRFSDYSFLRR